MIFVCCSYINNPIKIFSWFLESLKLISENNDNFALFFASLTTLNIFFCLVHCLWYLVLWWTVVSLLLLSPFSRVRLCATPETEANQAPPSLGFSRQEHWSGLPCPSPIHESQNWKGSHSVVSDSSWPHGLQPTRLLRPSVGFSGKSTGVGCHCLIQVVSLVGSYWLIWRYFWKDYP